MLSVVIIIYLCYCVEFTAGFVKGKSVSVLFHLINKFYFCLFLVPLVLKLKKSVHSASETGKVCVDKPKLTLKYISFAVTCF